MFSSGGGVPGPATNFNVEIYYPPDLFTKTANGAALAARPQIVSFSATTLGYGATLGVQMADTAAVAGVNIIGLSEATHSFNTFQRRVTLTVSQSGATLSVTMPSSANAAPPGYSLVTVLNAAGVPSRSVIVGLNAAAVPQASVTALLPIDGAFRAIESATQPGQVIRHFNELASLAAISPASTAVDRDDSSFAIRAGNANAQCYSFEASNFPGSFLRHQNYRLLLNASDNSAGFNADTTFCLKRGLTGFGFSLASFNFPNMVLHTRGDASLGIDASDGTAGFAAAASYALAPAP